MQKAVLGAAMGLFGLTAAPVQAMPIAPLVSGAPYLTLVAGGCGIGFHRGPYGGCRRNGGVGYGYGVVGPRYGVVRGPGYHYGYRGYGYHGGGYHYHYHYHYHYR
ncbi:MAG TPA: hypothetical protein VGL12_17645 [Roseiarcus sp.]|jgi:hypothetical protein